MDSLFRVFRWIPWLISDPSEAAIGCCWTESTVRICADLDCRGNKKKILGTIATLEKRGTLPETLVYCTSAKIGNSLDELKRDLRTNKKLSLEVHDAAWMVQRELSTDDREKLSDRYANEILLPIQTELNPNVLYSGILTDEQERLAFQYLEAQKIDRQSGGNLTKRIFDTLVVYAARESDPPRKVYSEKELLESVAAIFQTSHRQRVVQIVKGSIERLLNKRVLQRHRQANGYSLSKERKSCFRQNLELAQARDVAFQTALFYAIDKTAKEREIDYAFEPSKLAQLCHSCVFWHMKKQADRFVDPYGSVVNVIYADELITLYLKENPLKEKADLNEGVMDILPHVLYLVLNSKDKDIQRYLRDKADLFIMQGFLQVTPDVYNACKNLIGRDILYLDTSALIRCIAELYSAEGDGPLVTALRLAKTINIQLRVWKPHVQELASHLCGPVLLEWENHFISVDKADLEQQLFTATTLLRVFCEARTHRKMQFRSLVEEIIGQSNEVENVQEFLKEELGIQVEDVPPLLDGGEYEAVRSFWLSHKRRSRVMSDERFELLVSSDSKAYCAIVQSRKALRTRGNSYGQKIWLLTFDSMAWRIPSLIGRRGEHLYQVAMSSDYIVNYVATASQAGMLNVPEGVGLAIASLDETEVAGAEFREIVAEKWSQPDEKAYQRRRRLRDLVQDIKAGRADWTEEDDTFI